MKRRKRKPSAWTRVWDAAESYADDFAARFVLGVFVFMLLWFTLS